MIPLDGNLNDLNPDDITFLEVLKDASAAIYRGRGANGVLLLTTRRGKAGAPHLSYSGYAGQKSAYGRYDPKRPTVLQLPPGGLSGPKSCFQPEYVVRIFDGRRAGQLRGRWSGTPTGASTGSQQWNITSLMGRLHYAYADHYSATLTYRTDGSSRLPAGNKYGGFFGAAAAWNLANEHFLAGHAWLSQLKLRASVGRVGGASPAAATR